MVVENGIHVMPVNHAPAMRVKGLLQHRARLGAILSE
jgi:hypothetical protein